MAKKQPKRFTDVEMPRVFPQHDVAEHQVFMSFNNDDDAVRFDEWWSGEGAVLFQKFLDAPAPESKETADA